MFDASDLILNINNNHITSVNGDFIIGYKISYPQKYSQTKEDIEDFHAIWVKVCMHLPVKTIVLKSDVYIKSNCNIEPYNTSDLDVWFFNHFKDRSKITHTGYLFFVLPTRNSITSKCANPFNLIDTNFVHSDNETETFISKVNECLTVLPREYKCLPLTEQEFINYHTIYFNGFQSSYLTDTHIANDNIYSNNKIMGVCTINHEDNFPDNTYTHDKDINYSSSDNYYPAAFMDSIGVELDCSHILNQIIVIDDPKEHINRAKRTIITLGRSINIDSSNKINKDILDNYVEEAESNSSLRFVRGNTNIIFASDTLREFNELKSRISGILNTKGFVSVFPTNARLKDVYINSFCTNVSGISSNNLYVTSLECAVTLFALNTTYKNDDEGIYFTDRLYNSPVIYDFWDTYHKRKNERNFAVIAEPGSGKSVACQYIFSQLKTQQDVKNIIIDIGKSYERYALLFPPEEVHIINFRNGKGLGLNPFKIYENDDQFEKIESIEQFVWAIIKRDDTPSDEERTSLRRIITAFYSNVTDIFQHNFNGFYNFVKQNRDSIYYIAKIEDKKFFDYSLFVHNGEEFATGGIYAQYIQENNDTEQEIISAISQKRLVFIELDEIADNPLILGVAIMAIKEIIRILVWKDRLNKAIVVFEEFAKSLQIESIKNAVDFYMQTARKYNGSIGIVLQNVDQLTWETKKILENIGTFIFLKGTKIESTKEKLSLNEFTVSQLKSLKNNFSNDDNYKYSEIYIYNISSKIGMPYRIELPYETFLVFQTEGDLYEIINSLYLRFNDISSAVKCYIAAEKKNPYLRKEISTLITKNQQLNPLYSITDAVNSLI